MNQDTASKIILALLAFNTAMMIYCCIKRLSEEFQRVEKKSTTTAVATATQAPAKPAPAKAAAPSAPSQPAVAVPLPRSGRGNKL